jgi:hypothetical protein
MIPLIGLQLQPLPPNPTLELTNEEYHAHPALSRSALSLFDKSPLHFWHRYINPDFVNTESDSPALRFGTACHMRVLEPELFAETYIPAPPGSKTSKAYKEAEAEATEAGKKILTPHEYDQLDGIMTSLMNHPKANPALFGHGGINETSWIGKDPKTKLELKVRPDRIMNSGALVDLKTSIDASSSHFQRSAVNFGYCLQAAFYQHVMEICTGKRAANFYFVVVEKTPPYAVSVFQASQAFIAYGRTEMHRLLMSIQSCKKNYGTNPWPSYSQDIQVLELPSWIKFQN